MSILDNIELLKDVLYECGQKFKYMPEPLGLDYWQTPIETEKLKTGDCEDLSVWVIDRAYSSIVGGSLYIVWGTDMSGQGHSWIEYEDDNGERYWLDAVLRKGPISIEKWKYKPWMAAKYNGELFSNRFVYKAKLDEKLNKDQLPFGGR